MLLLDVVVLLHYITKGAAVHHFIHMAAAVTSLPQVITGHSHYILLGDGTGSNITAHVQKTHTKFIALKRYTFLAGDTTCSTQVT